jgi:hypothetical protein
LDIWDKGLFADVRPESGFRFAWNKPDVFRNDLKTSPFCLVKMCRAMCAHRSESPLESILCLLAPLLRALPCVRACAEFAVGVARRCEKVE